jgi:hypothetical protein
MVQPSFDVKVGSVDVCEINMPNLSDYRRFQCTYKVALMRVPATSVAVGKQCVTYSEYVSVALVIQHVMRTRVIIIYGSSGRTIFFHVIS